MTTGPLNRGLAVLEWLSANPRGLTVREIATKLSIPASATHRILADLVAREYVTQEEEYGKYSLTLKLCSLGLSQLSRGGVVDVAQPILEALARSSGEVARLGVVDGERLVWVAKAQGAINGLRFDPDMGGIVPLACTASGHAWLACLSDEDAARLVTRQGGLRRSEGDQGENAPRTLTELLEYLNQTRARGYSMLAEAVHVGIAAVAAPVRHAGTGQAIAVLAIAGPHVRLTDKKMAKLGPAVVQAAANLAAASAASPFLVKASLAQAVPAPGTGAAAQGRLRSAARGRKG